MTDELRQNRPVLRGERVILRSPQPADRQDRLAYGRSPEFRKMVGADARVVPPLTAEEVEAWYEQMERDTLHWVIEYEGRCIGTARLHALDTFHRRARYAVGIFDPALWGQGLGTETTRLVLRYAFEELRLHRVDARVLDHNQRAIACYAKCGFVREGVEREGAWIAGEWQSDVMMSLLEQEHRALTST